MWSPCRNRRGGERAWGRHPTRPRKFEREIEHHRRLYEHRELRRVTDDWIFYWRFLAHLQDRDLARSDPPDDPLPPAAASLAASRVAVRPDTDRSQEQSR